MDEENRPFKWSDELSKCELSTTDLVKRELKNPEAEEDAPVTNTQYEPESAMMKVKTLYIFGCLSRSVM